MVEKPAFIGILPEWLIIVLTEYKNPASHIIHTGVERLRNLAVLVERNYLLHCILKSMY